MLFVLLLYLFGLYFSLLFALNNYYLFLSRLLFTVLRGLFSLFFLRLLDRLILFVFVIFMRILFYWLRLSGFTKLRIIFNMCQRSNPFFCLAH